jgi:hypothetical protein
VEEYMNQLNYGVMELNNTGIDDPKFRYTPVRRGQATFIIHKCGEQKLRAAYLMGDVVIFSKRKLPIFLDIISQSLEIGYEPLQLTKETQAFYYGHALKCLMVRDMDATFVTEGSFEEIVRLQFLNQIPITKQYYIFNTQKEMKERLLEHNILL